MLERIPPQAYEIAKSVTGIARSKPAIVAEYPKLRIAPRMTIGSMFRVRPCRRITTKPEYDSAASNASALPSRVPVPCPPANMMPMPPSAASIAAQSRGLTLSLRRIQPSRAVRNGTALRMNIVLAMVV